MPTSHIRTQHRQFCPFRQSRTRQQLRNRRSTVHHQFRRQANNLHTRHSNGRVHHRTHHQANTKTTQHTRRIVQVTHQPNLRVNRLNNIYFTRSRHTNLTRRNRNINITQQLVANVSQQRGLHQVINTIRSIFSTRQRPNRRTLTVSLYNLLTSRLQVGESRNIGI